jgi:hypothetical protein
VQLVLVERRALGERVGGGARDLVESLVRVEAVLTEHPLDLLAELLEKVGRIVGDERAAEEERVLGLRRMDSAAEAVADGEVARIGRLVVALARDVRTASRNCEKRRAALEVGGGARRRLGERPRLALAETLARRAEREDLLPLHGAKTAGPTATPQRAGCGLGDTVSNAAPSSGVCRGRSARCP